MFQGEMLLIDLRLWTRGVKFSETFLKSFYRSKIVFHLEF